MPKLVVPGNILLLGEYAILEEGGLGIAMAIDRKITFSLEEAESLQIEGQLGSKIIRWTPDNPDSDNFIDAIYRECLKSIMNSGSIMQLSPSYKITIDSSSHRSPSGQKYGFGSSAVIACGLTFLLFYLAGLKKESSYLFKTALQSHRQAQGNRGSGYDIAASLHGGIGLFCGGRQPQWKPLDLPWLPPGFLFPGTQAVSTVSAVEKYQTFKAKNAKEVEKFYTTSNKLVEQFVNAQNWPEGMSVLNQYREKSIRFQKQFDMDASIAFTPDFKEKERGWSLKALGAGNELGSLWGNLIMDDPGSIIPINLNQSGPKWL